MTQLTEEAKILALNNAVPQKPHTAYNVTCEGLKATVNMRFIPKIVGVREKDGSLEQTPKVNENFKDIASTFITIEIDKSIGALPKNLIFNIYKSKAPNFYTKVLTQNSEGENFEKFNYEGEPILIGKIHQPRGFYIKNKNTKSGYSEDKQGRPVVLHYRPFVCFPDIEDLEALIRRDSRYLEDEGLYVDSKKPAVQIPEENTSDQIEDPNNPGHDVNGAPMRKAS